MSAPSHPAVRPRLWGKVSATAATTPAPASRVGCEFQASLPQLATIKSPPPASAAAFTATGPRSEESSSSSSSVDPGGECVWRGSAHHANLRQIDVYLANVRTLMVDDPSDYDEELALKFLHRCGYDTALALSLLAPTFGMRGNMPAAPFASSPPSSPRELGSDVDGDADSSGDLDTADYCCVCEDGGELIICERAGCRRVYHFACAMIDKLPLGKWECPRHTCQQCHRLAATGQVNDQPTVDETGLLHCSHCPISYCPAHTPNDLSRAHLIDTDSASESAKIFLCAHCSARKQRIQRIEALKAFQEAIELSSQHASASSNKVKSNNEEMTDVANENGSETKDSLHKLLAALAGPAAASRTNTVSLRSSWSDPARQRAILTWITEMKAHAHSSPHLPLRQLSRHHLPPPT